MCWDAGSSSYIYYGLRYPNDNAGLDGFGQGWSRLVKVGLERFG